MRRFFLLLFVLSFSVLVKAQFGYYSGNSVLQALPSYCQAKADYERLRQRCEEEIEHNEKELTRQYVAFLDGYREFPEPILRKRQNELQRLVDNSVNFRKELKKWLAQAKDSLYAPSHEAVVAAVEKVAVLCDLDYVIDTDVAVYKYINSEKAVDITRMLLDAALYPDKPATELDGYDEYAKHFNIVTAVSVPVIEETDTTGVVNNALATDEGDMATDEGLVQQ